MQPDQRVAPRGQHDPQSLRWPSEQCIECGDDPGVGDEMRVVEDEDQRALRVARSALEPAHDLSLCRSHRIVRVLWRRMACLQQRLADEGPECGGAVVGRVEGDPHESTRSRSRPLGEQHGLARRRSGADQRQRVALDRALERRDQARTGNVLRREGRHQTLACAEGVEQRHHPLMECSAASACTKRDHGPPLSVSAVATFRPKKPATRERDRRRPRWCIPPHPTWVIPLVDQRYHS